MTITSEQFAADQTGPRPAAAGACLAWPALAGVAAVFLLNAASLSLGMAFLRINAFALVLLAMPHLLAQVAVLLPASVLAARTLLAKGQEGWAYLVLVLWAGALLTNAGAILWSWMSGEYLNV